MNTTLYKQTYILFVLFFLFAIWGFYPSYYGNMGGDIPVRNHTHGIGMSLWCTMLVIQGLLVKFRWLKIHRWVGWVSYILVPYVIVSTVNLLHFELQKSPQLSLGGMRFITLVINSLLVFVALYCLAIWYKKKPLIHARYMIATIFPLFTPITDRLISRNYRGLLDFAIHVDGFPVIQTLGFYMVDVILLLFVIVDLSGKNKNYVFLITLIMNLMFQISVLYFFKWPVWQKFCLWFMSLPLS